MLEGLAEILGTDHLSPFGNQQLFRELWLACGRE